MTMNEWAAKFGRTVVARAIPILAGTAILVALSLVATARLGVDTEIANMLPPDNPVARSYTEISEEFESTSTLLVVVNAEGRDALIGAAEAFVGRISEDPVARPLIRSTRVRLDRPFAEKWGLMATDTDDLRDMEPALAQTRLVPLLRATNDVLESKLSDGDDEEVEGAEGEDASFALMSKMGLFARRLSAILERDAAFADLSAAGSLADAWVFGEEYMIDPEERTLLLQIRPSFAIGDRAKISQLLDTAKEIARDVSAERSGSGGTVSFSFTGDIAHEAAEEEALGSDVFYPSILAFGLIVALFYLSFERKRSIAFALLALLAGIVVDVGFAALTVVKLNMITSSFGALLVGLGIDFGIHIVSRYDEASRRGASPSDAMAVVFSETFMPVAIGGVTTAIAFYSLLASRTVAFRQFGLIAGTGILTTLAAAFVVLPALLALFVGARKAPARASRGKLEFSPARNAALAARARPRTTAAVALVLTAVAAWFIPDNAFEYDLRKIGPRDSSSMRAEDVVAERFGISVWQHFALADSPEAARDLSERYKTAPFVRDAESVADYVLPPAEAGERLSVIAGIAKARAGAAPGGAWTAEDAEAFVGELRRLEWNMVELGDLAAASLGERALPVRKRNAMIREIFGAESGAAGEEVFRRAIDAAERRLARDPAEALRALSAIDGEFAAALDGRLRVLLSVDRPLEPGDLPEDLRSDLVTEDGRRFLVHIQGAADLSGDEAVRTFTEGLSRVKTDTTGTLSLGFALSREILAESERAAALVGALILIAVFLGFRSLRRTLVAMAAFLCAFACVFGIAPAVGKFNIVSVLSLPLIIGIGIDYCVHVITALADKDDPELALGKTIKSVTLSMLTTLIGFGSLALIGQFKSVSDLGKTLSVGIICCYLAAILVVPALMGIRTKLSRS